MKRYGRVSKEKRNGVTYTPRKFADFVTSETLQTFIASTGQNITDNCYGDGRNAVLKAGLTAQFRGAGCTGDAGASPATPDLRLSEPAGGPGDAAPQAAPQCAASLATKLRIFDPAVGEGTLLLSMLGQIAQLKTCPTATLDSIEVYGFEIDERALDTARRTIIANFPQVRLRLEHKSFLDAEIPPCLFDIVIANPPYVRTQVLGSRRSNELKKRYGLTGRPDLYHSFVVAISRVLSPTGAVGIILSNKFLTTRSGTAVRTSFSKLFRVRHIWDFGDSKLFKASVLPAVVIASGRAITVDNPPLFTSIYETDRAADLIRNNIFQALSLDTVVETADGRKFLIRQGALYTGLVPANKRAPLPARALAEPEGPTVIASCHSGPTTSGIQTEGCTTGGPRRNKCGKTITGVWRISTRAAEDWLETVSRHTWGTFRDIGKIRVGVKTCADKVFIRNDWLLYPEKERPELLRTLLTHRNAGRFRGTEPSNPSLILYPHFTRHGRTVTISPREYPKTMAYLEKYRVRLESRTYLLNAGRKWWEIWIPQSPAAWSLTKLVFRDIARTPAFWIDQTQSVVNGDCYWLVADNPENSHLLWLAAAVGNSHFIEKFYDYRFPNLLYAGRRRFISQYVEQFPLPDPESETGRLLISKSREIYECSVPGKQQAAEKTIEHLVCRAFGVDS